MRVPRQNGQKPLSVTTKTAPTQGYQFNTVPRSETNVVCNLRVMKGLFSSLENGLDSAQVVLRVHADGVVGGRGNVDIQAVFQEPKLFEALGALQATCG